MTYSGSAPSARLKAKQSPIVTSAVQATLTFEAQLPFSQQALTSHPSRRAPGRGSLRGPTPRLPLEGVTDGEVPRAPPPLSPADLPFTSSAPGSNLGSIPEPRTSDGADAAFRSRRGHSGRLRCFVCCLRRFRARHNELQRGYGIDSGLAPVSIHSHRAEGVCSPSHPSLSTSLLCAETKCYPQLQGCHNIL